MVLWLILPTIRLYRFFGKLFCPSCCRVTFSAVRILLVFKFVTSAVKIFLFKILPQCDVVQVVCCSGFTKVLSTLFLEVFRENFDD
ncbi:hypothetical protein P8452_72806 [Trifolium repens]|nr:hypothetical protein P8452_72806 [Trifolium repens]